MTLTTFIKQRRPLADELAAHGFRMTRQRRVITEVLQKAGRHLDAASVWRIAREKLSGLDLATVYRTLQALKKLGMIDELDLLHLKGSSHYYEARTEKDHLHFTCKHCAAVVEIQSPLFERLKGQIEGRYGLHIEVTRLEMGGLCGRCAQGKEKAGRVPV